MPGSHLVCDAERERLDVGVSMAPVEAALRAAGGIPSGEGPTIGRCGSGA